MARVNNLNDFLTDVAGAIKTKKGSETAIPAANFDTEILALPSQGTYEQKTLRVSTNGTQTVVPSSGFDAIDELELIVAVPGSTINNQDKTITQNGTYTADSGYTGLGTVIVNVPQEGGSGDVKQFESVAQMQASTGNQEGDLAIVYNSQILPLTENSIFQIATFPDTVVLDEAIPSGTYINAEFMNAEDETADDGGYCNLSSDDFSFSYYGDSSNVDIRYTSNDGINYTRTDSVGNPVDFGVKLKFGSRWGGSRTFDSRIGNFIKVSQSVFTGLYEYKQFKDKTRFQFLSINSPKYLNDEITMEETPIGNIYNFADISEIRTTMWNNGIRTNCAFIDNNDKLYFVALTDRDSDSLNSYIYNNNGELTHLGNDGRSFTSVSLYEIDVENETYTFSRTINTENVTIYNSDGTTISRNGVPITSLNPKTMIMVLNQNNMAKLDYRCFSTKQYLTITNATSSPHYYDKNIGYIYYQFGHASTQLSVAKASQLLDGVSAYGSNGVITGDGSIWTNNSLEEMNEKILGYDFSNSNYYFVVTSKGKYQYNYGFLNLKGNDLLQLGVYSAYNYGSTKLKDKAYALMKTRFSNVYSSYVRYLLHPDCFIIYTSNEVGAVMICDYNDNVLYYNNYSSYTQKGIRLIGANDDYAFFMINVSSSSPTDAVIRINLSTYTAEEKRIAITPNRNSSSAVKDNYATPFTSMDKAGNNFYMYYTTFGHTGSSETWKSYVYTYNFDTNTSSQVKYAGGYTLDSEMFSYSDVSGDKALIINNEYKSGTYSLTPYAILYDASTKTTTNVSGIRTSATNKIKGMYNSTLDKYYLLAEKTSLTSGGNNYGLYEISSDGTLSLVIDVDYNLSSADSEWYGAVCGDIEDKLIVYMNGKILELDLTNNTYEIKDANSAHAISNLFYTYTYFGGAKCVTTGEYTSYIIKGSIENMPNIDNDNATVYYDKSNDADSVCILNEYKILPKLIAKQVSQNNE